MKIITLFCTLLFSAQFAYADSFDNFFKNIQERSRQELQENKKRELEFRNNFSEAQKTLENARAEMKRLEQRSSDLQKTLDENEKQIADLESERQRKMGDLGELFGVVRQISGELSSELQNSMISAHYPDRVDFLKTLSQEKGLPDILVLEEMWKKILEELDQSRKIVRTRLPVLQKEGKSQVQDIVRIGSFGAVSEGDFLTYSPDSRQFAVAVKQPGIRYRKSAKNFAQPKGDFVTIMIDPTRGQLLEMLTQKPSFLQRIAQGGLIGYIIIAIGLSGMFLALIRYIILVSVHRKIKAQTENLEELSEQNPLGRIALVYHAARHKSAEEKEALCEEAVLKEIPAVEKYNSLVKLLAAVSPLLGLLGTVTGMIITFQSITLFGTSDPRLMAGGISTALVTTVLGLTMAIPLLFIYTFIAGKSKTIVDILEYESIGLIAKKYSQTDG